MKNQFKLTLGEGKTPLIRLYNLEQKLKWRVQLWAKCEFQNPTGSFKDRGSVAEISEALRKKKRGVVCASTGNMAASLAAYAARAKLSCAVFIPQTTPQSKMRQTEMCGAKLIKVNGNYNDCVKQAEIYASSNDYLLCGDYEVRRLGQRSIGIEIARTGKDFGAFVVPIGNGTVGCAVAEGLAQENKFPKFIGVRAIGNNASVASAMKVKFPLDKEITNNWVSKTGGQLFEVSDEEIINAQKLLAKTEGVFVETAAASTVAVLPKINSKESIVLILTGSGLKEGGENYGME